jgi:hypothetical protein
MYKPHCSYQWTVNITCGYVHLYMLFCLICKILFLAVQVEVKTECMKKYVRVLKTAFRLCSNRQCISKVHFYLHAMTVFHYTLLYHIPIPNFSQGVLHNTRQSIWRSSLCPATLQTVLFMWPIPVVTFPALSPDEGDRRSYIALNAYSQHDLVSVSDWCCVAI